MSFPRYAEYKDSGLEWLGEIPGHWEMPPLYSRYAQVLGKMVDQNKVTGIHPMPYIRNVDVQWDSVNADNLPVIDIQPSEHTRFTVNKGDLLICEGGEIGRTAIWQGGDGKVAFQKAIHRLRPHDDTENVRFFFYTMQFATAMQVFLANSNPNTIPHLTGEQLRGYRLPKPTLVEQDAIVAFLDTETSKIDALVAEQRRLIELLKEKRQAVISHAVTKGLDPNVKMKPSGIEWLGDVPEHWAVGGLTRFIGPVVDYRGRTPTKVDEGIFLVTARNVREGKIDYAASEEFVDPESAASLLARGMPGIGDLLFTMEAPLGQVALIDRTDVALAQRIVKFRGTPNVMQNNFLLYWIMGSVCQARLETLATGSTALGIKASKLGMIECVVPPMDDQTLIVSYIDRETAKLDALTAEAEQAITLLQERRTALISAAVTGKIDVRGID